MGILETVTPTFLVIGLAYGLQRYKKMDTKPLIEIALYLASPCLIFSSLSSKVHYPWELLPVALSAALIVMGSLAVSRAVFWALRLSDVDARTLPVILINAGNLGLPICLFAFGEAVLGIVVMFFVTTAIFNYTLGIYLAARNSGPSNRPWLETFKLPLVYATGLGIAASILEVRIPLVVSRAVDILGQAAIPLFLISLGMSLAEIRPRQHLRAALLSGSMRIGIGLAFGLASVVIFNLEGAVRGVVIVESSMPPAVASFMISKKFGCNPEIVAATVFTGTLVSIFTIPLVLRFVA